MILPHKPLRGIAPMTLIMTSQKRTYFTTVNFASKGPLHLRLLLQDRYSPWLDIQCSHEYRYINTSGTQPGTQAGTQAGSIRGQYVQHWIHWFVLVCFPALPLLSSFSYASPSPHGSPLLEPRSPAYESVLVLEPLRTSPPKPTLYLPLSSYQ